MRLALALLALLCTLLATAPASGQARDLLLSEYVEGSGNNKALEISNRTGADADLAGWSVAIYTNGSATPSLVIALTGTIADGDVFVLAHPSASAALLALADQTAGGNWFNGDDAVALLRQGAPIDVLGQIGFDPGSEWGAGATSTQDNTLRRSAAVLSGDRNGSDVFDPSLEWFGFAIDNLDGLGQPPGREAQPLCPIAAIQGAAHTSPLVGSAVQTTGVVTAVAGHGFFLQDPIGDRDPATSEGLFVFTSLAPAVVPGDLVSVTATVSEFQPGGASTGNLTSTELTAPTVTLLASGQPLPAPVVLGAAGLLLPTELIDDDGLAVFDPATDGLDALETVEGMRVLVDEPLAVSARNAFDELVTVTDAGAFATGLNSRSGLTISPADFNPERIQVQLDDELLPDFRPSVTVGDRLGDVVGVVTYSFGNYEVRPTQPFTVTRADLAPEVASPAGDGDVLSIATANVHNLDPKLESFALVAGFQDIDDDVGDGYFAALAARIVQHLRKPEIIGLQEIQDDDGAEQTDVTGAGLTAATLTQAIVDVGGPAYAYRDVAPLDDSSGGQPGGNIRVALLFDPARVTLDEASLQALADPDLGDGDAFAGSRRPLVATFAFRGRDVTVIVNHFTSKSGGTPLFGAVQPPQDGGLAKRLAQAQVVHDAVAQRLAADPAANVVVLGDLNDFAFSAPLATLKGAPPLLADLSDSLPALERYSYVFDGNSQDLDHILASPALAPLADYDVVHVNAEFVDPPSDHDPLLSRFRFRDVCQPDLGFAGPGSVSLSVCGDPLAPTGHAMLQASGLPPGGVSLLIYGLTALPTSTHGGVLIPVPPAGLLPLIDTDRDGALALSIDGALARQPLTLITQLVALDRRQRLGFSFSNAVELEFAGR